MEPTRSRAAQFLDAHRAAFRHDDEEFDTPPRWIRSRLHSDLALSAAVEDRLVSTGKARREGGQ